MKKPDPLHKRDYIWRETMPLLADTPLVGKGPGTFAFYFPQEYELVPGTYVDRPHNMYMQIAHHSGDLAAFIFIVGLSYFICKAWRGGPRHAKRSAAVAGIVGYAVAGFATDSYVGVAPLFWILLGAGFALL